MSLTLRLCTGPDHAASALIKVDPAQQAFVEPIATILALDSSRDNHVMEKEGHIIGFFQIDHSTDDRIFPDHATLHEVMIDYRQQGKGYGRAFMDALPGYLKTTYPNHKGIALTVNCHNPDAKKVYKYGGFEDTGDLKLDGPSGPQHIMRRTILS